MSINTTLINKRMRDSQTRRAAGLPTVGSQGMTTFVRSAAGIPGRAAAGLPTNFTNSRKRGMDGPDEGSPNAKLVPSVCSPKISSLLNKMYCPIGRSLRFPDNNLVPCVNIMYTDYTQYTIGSDCPPNPMFVFIPSKGSGFFVMGGKIAVGSESRFVPSAVVPESRKLDAYTYVRNTNLRVCLKSGTISTTNFTLAGTFNACSFNDIRDFSKFDASEFSTLCIKDGDFVQGERSDMGLVMATGPECVGQLRPRSNETVNSGGTVVNLGGQSTHNGSSDFKTIFDYFLPAGRLFGLLMSGTRWDCEFLVENTKVLPDNFMGVVTVFVRVTLSTTKPDGTLNSRTVTINRSAPFVGALSARSSSTIILNNTLLDDSQFGLITKIEIAGGAENFGASTQYGGIVIYNLRARDTFDLGNHGPGLVASALSLNTGSVITLQLARSVEGMPGGTLLPDLKSNMRGYEAATPDELAALILELGKPESPYKRVYTLPSFVTMIATTCGELPNLDSIDATGSSVLEAEDRMMAGPITTIADTLLPLASLIPGIGPIIGGVGGVVSSLAKTIGLSGPCLSYDTSQDADSDSFRFLAGRTLFNEELALGVHQSFTPSEQMTPDELMVTLAERLAANSSSARYRLASAGYPFDDPVYVANLAVVDGSVGKIEYIVSSKKPMLSYDSDGNLSPTTYTQVTLSYKDEPDSPLITAFLSDDFHRDGNLETSEGQTAAYNTLLALAFADTNDRYITLPVFGKCSGPSLGLPLLVASLGVIDRSIVYSGGLGIGDDGSPIVTEIYNVAAKQLACQANRMTLVCGRDPTLDAVLNLKDESSGLTAYASASAVPLGARVARASAIVVTTLAEALFIGLTCSDLPQSRTSDIEVANQKLAELRTERETKTREFNDLLGAGNIKLPASLQQVLKFNSPVVSLEDLAASNLPQKVTKALTGIKSEAAATNIKAQVAKLSEYINNGSVAKAYNIMESLGQFIKSQEAKEAKAPANAQAGGFVFGNQLQKAQSTLGNSKNTANQMEVVQTVRPPTTFAFGSRQPARPPLPAATFQQPLAPTSAAVTLGSRSDARRESYKSLPVQARKPTAYTPRKPKATDSNRPGLDES